MSIQKTYLVLPAAFLVASALACGGASTSAGEPERAPPSPIQAPSSVAPPASAFVHALTGIWSDDGKLVSEVRGARTLKDIAVYSWPDVHFVYSDDRKAYTLDPTATPPTVSEVSAEYAVRRVVGRCAIVEPSDLDQPPQGMARLAVRCIGEDQALPIASVPGLPLTEPEYWWTTDFSSLAVPVDTAPGPDRSLSIVRPDGEKSSLTALVDATGLSTGAGLALRSSGESVLVDGRGEAEPLPFSWKDFQRLGRPSSSSRALLAQRHDDSSVVLSLDAGAPRPLVGALDWDGERKHCPRFSEAFNNCAYRFHDGLAAVWVLEGTEPSAAYVAEDGTFAIGPDACTSSVPSGPFRDGRAFHCRGNAYHLIDSTGTTLAGPYPYWSPKGEDDRNGYPLGLFFSDGLAAVPTATGGWQYIRPDGSVALAGPFEVARPFRAGFAQVKDSKGVRIINKDGAEVFVEGK